RIARAIECRNHHHPVSIKDVAEADKPQRVCAVTQSRFFLCEDANNWLCKNREHNRHDAQKDHVSESCYPHRTLCALRLACSQILTNQSCSRVAHAPRWQ